MTVTGPDGGEAVSITLPLEYRPGDVVRVRLIGDACRKENDETESTGQAFWRMMYVCRVGYTLLQVNGATSSCLNSHTPPPRCRCDDSPSSSTQVRQLRTPPTNAVDDEKDAAKLDKAVGRPKPTGRGGPWARRAVA